MSPLFKFLIFSLFLFLPCWLWYKQTGDLSLYFNSSVPKGQLSYILSKLVGMLGLSCMTLQIMTTLFIKLKRPNSKWLGFPHRLFGMLILVLIFTHILLFFFAASLRQDKVAWSLWLPDFHNFYQTNLSFGLIAMLFLSLVAVSGIGRYRQKFTWVSKVHYVYWPALCLIYIHALAIGSELQSPIGMLFYLSLGSFTFLLALISLLAKGRTKWILG